MGLNTKKTEGGSGGKKGHSNMSHWEGTEEIKKASKKGRRLQDKKIAKEAMNESMGDITPEEWAEMEREKAEWRKNNVKEKSMNESIHEKFITFLESFKGSENDSLIEAIQTGFQACFEDKETDAVLDIMNMEKIPWNEAKAKHDKVKAELGEKETKEEVSEPA